MKERDADKSASEKGKHDRRKGDRRKTPPSPWESPDVPSTREELAGLVKEIITTQGSGVKPPGAKLRRGSIALAGAFVLALSAAPIAWAFWWPRSVEIPDGMVGRWTTSVSMYADRSFTVAKDSVTFLTSAQDSTIHPIVDVRSRPNERGTAYTIYYASFGADLEFSVVYSDGPDATIEFINQRGMIWRKER